MIRERERQTASGLLMLSVFLIVTVVALGGLIRAARADDRGVAIFCAIVMVLSSLGLAGLFTVAQFSFWGNYLPRVYPTYLRGTGESFAANVGGRMIGTMAALVTVQLVTSMPGGTVPVRLAYASAIVGTTAYVIGIAASRWLPEPKQDALPD